MCSLQRLVKPTGFELIKRSKSAQRHQLTNYFIERPMLGTLLRLPGPFNFNPMFQFPPTTTYDPRVGALLTQGVNPRLSLRYALSHLKSNPEQVKRIFESDMIYSRYINTLEFSYFRLLQIFSLILFWLILHSSSIILEFLHIRNKLISLPAISILRHLTNTDNGK